MDVNSTVGEKAQAFEMICSRRILNISYKDHFINVRGKNRTSFLCGQRVETEVFSNVAKSSVLAKTTLQETVLGKRSGGKTI